jgi:squalene-associated FAD-dependent desaturase
MRSGPARVLVAGGGLAGITACIHLARSGAEVVLVEPRERLGGLAASARRRGLLLDNGQHIFLRGCTEYRRFLAEVGAEDLVWIQPRLRIPVVRRGDLAFLERGEWPAPFHMGKALLGYRFLSFRDKAALGVQVSRLLKAGSDQVSVGELLGDASRLGSFWELFLRPVLNLDPASCSAAAAADVLRLAFFSSKDFCDIGLLQAPLHHVHHELSLKALHELAVEVRLGWRVASFEARTGGVAATLVGEGDEERAPFDALVVATDHKRAGQMLADLLADPSFVGAPVSPIVNVHLFLEDQVLGHRFVASLDPWLQYVFDRSDSSPVECAQYLVVSLSAAVLASRVRDEELVYRVREALARELGLATRPLRVVEAVVTREGKATVAFVPGFWGRRPGPATSSPRVFVAGAYTRTGWPATMESAVRSGRMAAEACLERID